jgi:hypothetical protein
MAEHELMQKCSWKRFAGKNSHFAVPQASAGEGKNDDHEVKQAALHSVWNSDSFMQ